MSIRCRRKHTWTSSGHYCLTPTEGTVLRDWDLRYTADSRGAFLFEVFYQSLFREVFGEHGFGAAVVEHLLTETGTFVDFYLNFDRILLAEDFGVV